MAISLLNTGCDASHPCVGLVRNIQDFSNLGGVYPWNHVFWEANQAANALAKHGLSLHGQCRIFDSIPDFFVFDSSWGRCF